MGPKYTEAAFRARGKGTIEGKTLAFDLDLQDIAFLRVLKNDYEFHKYVSASPASVGVLYTGVLELA